MESLLIFLIVILLVINLGVIYYLAKSKSEVKENNLDQNIIDFVNFDNQDDKNFVYSMKFEVAYNKFISNMD